MLELRPTCENCGKNLSPDSVEAKICSFECTYCTECADEVFQNVCPNCGGGFVFRPIRPKAMLAKHPASNTKVEKAFDPIAYNVLQEKMLGIKPSKR